MCLKIRCDEESGKFCKIFWELNKARVTTHTVSSPDLTKRTNKTAEPHVCPTRENACK